MTSQTPPKARETRTVTRREVATRHKMVEMDKAKGEVEMEVKINRKTNHNTICLTKPNTQNSSHPRTNPTHNSQQQLPLQNRTRTHSGTIRTIRVKVTSNQAQYSKSTIVQ